MVTTVEFEGCVVGACIFRVVAGKFSHWKEPGSIILLVVGKSPEISLHYTVLPLGLAVSLGMEGGGEPLFDPQEVA